MELIHIYVLLKFLGYEYVRERLKTYRWSYLLAYSCHESESGAVHGVVVDDAATAGAVESNEHVLHQLCNHRRHAHGQRVAEAVVQMPCRSCQTLLEAADLEPQ